MMPGLSDLAGKVIPGLRSGSGSSYLINIGHLLSGSAMGGFLALVSVGLAARTLTAETFGIFVLILAFVRTVERLLRFESWQPLIKFAADLEETDQRAELSCLYLLGILLDIGAAAAAAGIAIAIAFFVSPLIGIDAGHLGLVAISAAAVLFNIKGAPTASLRMANRYRSIAYCQLIGPVLRIPLAAFCWWHGLGLTSFVICWTLAQVSGSLVFMALGYKALRAQRIANPFRNSPVGLLDKFPGFISFAWSTNLSMTMRTLTQEADTLLVGSLAGASSAGFYHLAKRLAKIAQEFGAQTQAVLYPEMARMWAKEKFGRLMQLTRRLQLVLGLIGACAVLGAMLVGEKVVTVFAGAHFKGVAPILVTQLLAVTCIMMAAPLRSLLLTMDKPQAVLKYSTYGAVAFFVSGFLLVPNMGAVGASIAQFLSALIVMIGLHLTGYPVLTRRLVKVAG